MNNSEKVKTHFINYANSFDSLYSENKSNKIIRFINKKFRRDIYERFLLTMNHVRTYQCKNILDVGCGSGRYELSLIKFNIDKLVGIDFSNKMIELAINNLNNEEKDEEIKRKVNFICCAFEDFITNETFDTVIAMGFFDYIKDPVKVLTKMNKLCNHSVIASFPSISFYRTPIRKFRYYFKNCPVYFYTRKKIELISKEAGFSSVKIFKIKGAGMDYFVTFYK